MTPIRPQDLPELRAALAAHSVSDDGLRGWMQTLAINASFYQPLINARREPAADLALIVHRSAMGELYFVSAEMTELARTAGETLPFFGLEAPDLPSSAGLLLFEDPPLEFRESDPDRTIMGATWTVDVSGRLVWLTPVVRIEDGAPELGSPQWWMFQDGRERPVDWNETANAQDRIFEAVHAAWLLMQQPLTQTTEIEPDRAIRKRLRRMNHEPAPVRVIELRRPVYNGSSPGGGSREYHHQWITRGHWRNQWHPKREVHRPVWIAPHVKGPAGSPLLGGEKVYALKR